MLLFFEHIIVADIFMVATFVATAYTLYNVQLVSWYVLEGRRQRVAQDARIALEFERGNVEGSTIHRGGLRTAGLGVLPPPLERQTNADVPHPAPDPALVSAGQPDDSMGVESDLCA